MSVWWSLPLIVVLLVSLTAPFVTTNSQAQMVSEIEVLHTAVNPAATNLPAEPRIVD